MKGARFGLLLLSAVGFAAPARIPARGPNLLRNPSFETEGSADITNPPGWTRWTEIGAAGLFTWDNMAGRVSFDRQSTFALRVENTGARGGWIAAEPVPVRDTATYLLCGFVSVHRSAGEARYGVRFTGSQGLLSELWTPAVTGSTGAGVSDWVAVAARVRPPEGATFAQVICRADHLTGPAWFDDVGFYEVPERAPRPQRTPTVSAFADRAAAAERAIAGVRQAGGFWEAAGVALAQARAMWGVSRQDESAGWMARSQEHAREAVGSLERAVTLAKRDGARSDPLPAAPGTPPVPAGVVYAWRGDARVADVTAELATLARFGLTDVETDFPWGLWEPARGTFDFSVPEALADRAGREGMRLWPVAGPRYAGIGGRLKGARTSLRGYTSWFFDAFPDYGLRSSSGETVHGVDGLFREFMFMDPRRLASEPDWLAAWETAVRALGAAFGGKPGMGGWLLCDAPRFGGGPDASRGLVKPGLLGYNDEYLEGFRHWVKERYATLPALRAVWGPDAVRTSRFETVDAPGPDEINFAEPVTGKRYRASQPWIADWLEFRATALGEGLGWQQRLLAPSTAAPVLPEVTIAGPLDPDGVSAEAVGAATSGPVAMNLVPAAVPFPLLTHAQDVAIDAARAAGPGRPVWLTGYGFHVSGVMGGDEREDVFAAPYVDPYVWGAVLSGVRGFFFDGWTGRTGPGSLAFPGRTAGAPLTLADEGMAVARAVAAIKVVAPWLTTADVAPPRYGVLVSRDAVLFDDPEAGHAHALLNALALAGIHEVPVVTERSLQDGATACDVLFAPGVTRLSSASIAALAAFVDRGGVLIADGYLATREASGAARAPFADGLGELFGITAGGTDGRWSDDGLVGFLATASLSELAKPLPVSLSWYSGGFRVNAGAGTQVLAEYSLGTAARPLPAITVHAHGKGRAVLVPRVKLWPGHLDELRAAKLPRPELRELKLGRSAPDFSGECWALTLRAVLRHLDVLPAARLIRAPVATAFLDGQAALQATAGLSSTELAVSGYLVRSTQASGLPFIARNELIALTRQYLVNLDELAPVRVNLLRGPKGRVAVAINVSSWGRDAELAVPVDATAAEDLLTGEPWPVTRGRLTVPMGPYQARLLALF